MRSLMRYLGLDYGGRVPISPLRTSARQSVPRVSNARYIACGGCHKYPLFEVR